ncbi:DUF4102 domain-containing protein [Cereibacter changlensis]|uniref:DUF4102 domain-containing protein n=1 Tax=Cereibacter changlensis TaxID=402884 RepID=A0A4U0YX82_9RHOB|nr:DUF4102 domain-containing protein [Cereibacter changlensis]
MTVPSLFTPAVIRNARPGAREYTLHDAHVVGFGLRVQPSGAKSWVLRMGKRRITIGPAEQIPLATARAHASKLIAGEAPPPVPATALSFDALADLFLAEKEGVYRPQTLASYRIEISPKVGDGGSGGGLKLAQAVAELNPLDDLWQAVPAVELAPFALRGDHQFERHGQTGLAAQAPFGAFRAMTDRGEGAFDRV